MNPNTYIKITYWSSCPVGNLYMDGSQRFAFYLNAFVGESEEEYTEEGEENGEGHFVATFKRLATRYQIKSGVQPPFMVDAVRRLKLHENILIDLPDGTQLTANNLRDEIDWIENGLAANITISFDVDEIVVVRCCGL